MQSLRITLVLTAALALPGMVACSKEKTTEVVETPAGTEVTSTETTTTPISTNPSPMHRTADVTLQSQDPKVSGTVHFSEEPNGVHVVADVKGVKPGMHGFHLHEKGDCSTPDYKSAGGHFNPGNASHACDPTTPRHAGDFGNVTVGADGTGHLDATVTSLSFDGANSVLGKAVILHAGQDDCKTQPTGNSGDRLACGAVSGGAGGGMAASGTESSMGTEAMGTH